MKQYIVRVRLNNGSFTEMAFTAMSSGLVQTMVESQFGSGSFLGVLQEDYI